MIDSKKRGRLVLGKKWLSDLGDGLQEMLEQLAIFPIRCEHLFHADAFDIVGISEFFDEVEEGAIIPIYYVHAIQYHDTPEKMVKQWAFSVEREDRTEEPFHIIDTLGEYSE